MRPIPQSRHLWAILIFVAVSVACGRLAMLDDRLSDPQTHLATSALKRHQPDLFAGDAAFGTSLWQAQTPALQGAMEMVLIPTAYRDPALPFRVMTGLAVMLYLVGMYALIYRQCRSWSVAAFVAVLSSAVTNTLGGGFWGVGSLGSITPQGLVLAVTPLIVLSFLRYSSQWRILLVFAFVGLCGNLHVASAMNLTIVLLVVYLAQRRFAPSTWPMTTLCALCALGGVAPYTAYYLGVKATIGPPDTIVATAAVLKALGVGRPDVLYPKLLGSVLNWLLVAAVLAIPAAAVLSRVERFRVRDLRVWVYFACTAIVVAMGFQGLSQLAGSITGRPPLIIGFVQAGSLVMLPLYILFAQALTNLFRLIRNHRAWLRWTCTALALAWIVPSDNFRICRHAIYDTATMFMAEERKPLRVQELHRRRERQAELRRMAVWASNPKNTPVTSLFVTDDVGFRMLARRGIVASADDFGFFYHMAPWRLENWTDLVRRSDRMTRPRAGARANAQQLRQFADDLSAQAQYAQVTQWYAILRAENAPARPDPIEEIHSQSWGRHYRLYRLR